MKLKMLVYITLLLLLSAGVAQAAEETKCLNKIGEHPVHEPLTSEEELCEMMQDEKVWYDIAEALSDAECLGIQCSELSTKINEFFTDNCRNIQQCKIQKENYKKEDSVTFHWMMFRPNGKGKIKVAKNLKWCGAEDLPAYEFDIVYDKKKYTFTVPKGCGNLALLKVTEECPNPCKDCNDCSTDCKINGNCGSPDSECSKCWKGKCFVPVEVEVEVPVKVEKIVTVNPCRNCNDCSYECKTGGECENTVCRKCQSNDCFVPVTKTITCIQPCPPAFHFIADLGYYRQSDPADYLFGRVGIEYNLSENASWLEGVSLLTMIGAAPKIGGSDGDTAFLLDVIAQYNWLQSYDSWSLPLLRGFTGIGLGGWFTSGDVLDDSGDSDLDIIANIGVRLPNHPDISVFFEMRNAVDELDSISEYGRFGAGVRIQF